MSAGPRIVIVGAGAAGLSTALHAARLGARSVIVVERDYPASGSSGRSAGIFNRQTPNALELELRAHSVSFLETLTSRGLPLVRNGYVRIARTDDDLKRFAQTLERQRELGIADTRVIDRDELAQLVPGMVVDDFVGGLYGPSDGHLDGHLLCQTYLEWATELGVELRPRTRVVGVDMRARAITVHTSGGALDCDVLVNAAGAWADEVAALAGLRMPIANQRHKVCIAHLPAPFATPVPAVNTYMPGSGGGLALYFRQETPSTILTGLHSHGVVDADELVDPDSASTAVDLDYVELLAEQLSERLPLWDLRLQAGWAGLYPISPDGRFQVGPYTREPRVIAAGGLGGVGLTSSPAVGRLAAEWAVTGEATSLSAAADLLPERASLAAGTRA